MNQKELLEKVVMILQKEKMRHALAGGIIASLYRTEERLTKDLDFLFLSDTNTEKNAIRVIESLGFEVHIVRKADLEGGPLFAIKKKNTAPYIIAGRAKGSIGLDFILPQMPWFETALERAEKNKRDFGFGQIPCITVEDMLISKFYSYQNDQRRFKDLDDLQSIFEANHSLDLNYLSGQMNRLGLKIPPPIKALAPKVLVLMGRKK